MRDLAIELDDRPGTLAELGEALGHAGVSVEGGGAWVVETAAPSHTSSSRTASRHARRWRRQASVSSPTARSSSSASSRRCPARLGNLSRRMAESGVNIEVLYSDHANQLILVVDDVETGRTVSEEWMRDWS